MVTQGAEQSLRRLTFTEVFGRSPQKGVLLGGRIVLHAAAFLACLIKQQV